MSRKRTLGYTVMELIMSTAIVAIAAAVAVPTFSNSVNNARVRNAATGLQISLMRARSEATKRNANMRVLPRSGSWSNGWEVRGPMDIVVDSQPPTKGATIVSGVSQVVYQSSGRLQPGPAATFDIKVGPAGAEKVRCVVVDISGRAFVKESSC